VRVVLTRSDDYLLSLDDRKKVANSNSPGVYVSLHFGAAPSPALHGPRVYVLAAPKVNGTASLPNVEEAHGTSLNESWRLATILSQALALLGASEPATDRANPLGASPGCDDPSVLIEVDYLTAEDVSRWTKSGHAFERGRNDRCGRRSFLKPDSPLDRTPAQRDNPAP